MQGQASPLSDIYLFNQLTNDALKKENKLDKLQQQLYGGAGEAKLGGLVGVSSTNSPAYDARKKRLVVKKVNTDTSPPLQPRPPSASSFSSTSLINSSPPKKVVVARKVRYIPYPLTYFANCKN